eukprot:553844_1
MEDGTVFEVVILFVCIGIFFSGLTKYIQNGLKLPLPYSIFVLIIGLIIGFILKQSSTFTNTINQIESFDIHLFQAILIPPIIFQHSFHLNYHHIKKEFNQSLSVLLLCGPTILINISLTTLFIYFIYPYNFSIFKCLIFSSIITVSDPIIISFISNELSLNQRLSTLIKCESLINTGITFVIYMIAIHIISSDQSNDDMNNQIYKITGMSLQLFFG